MIKQVFLITALILVIGQNASSKTVSVIDGDTIKIGGEKFIEDERFARANKLGLWSMKFEYPWKFRKL